MARKIKKPTQRTTKISAEELEATRQLMIKRRKIPLTPLGIPVNPPEETKWKPAIYKPEEEPICVEARLAELEGDMIRLVEAIGGLFGEHFRVIGRTIVNRRQGRAR